MTIAARTLNHHMRQRGLCRQPKSIYAVVLDGPHAHALTEDHLDAWWTSLSPEDKAETYEQRLGDGTERCRYCGCTEHRACLLADGQGCSWLDGNHTVCSAPECATRHAVETFEEVFGRPPASGEMIASSDSRTVAELMNESRATITACGATAAFLARNPDVLEAFHRKFIAANTAPDQEDHFATL